MNTALCVCLSVSLYQTFDLCQHVSGACPVRVPPRPAAPTHWHSEDTDEVIEAQQRAHDLLVALHDDVNPGADALVHELWTGTRQEKGRRVCRAPRSRPPPLTGRMTPSPPSSGLPIAAQGPDEDQGGTERLPLEGSRTQALPASPAAQRALLPPLALSPGPRGQSEHLSSGSPRSPP